MAFYRLDQRDAFRLLKKYAKGRKAHWTGAAPGQHVIAVIIDRVAKTTWDLLGPGGRSSPEASRLSLKLDSGEALTVRPTDIEWATQYETGWMVARVHAEGRAVVLSAGPLPVVGDALGDNAKPAP